jgi:hypothetical protein
MNNVTQSGDGNDRSVIDGDPNEGKKEHEGVDVPEDFQVKAHALVSKATKPHLNHLRAKISSREDELFKEQHDKESANRKAKRPMTFSTEDMPSSD